MKKNVKHCPVWVAKIKSHNKEKKEYIYYKKQLTVK